MKGKVHKPAPAGRRGKNQRECPDGQNSLKPADWPRTGNLRQPAFSRQIRKPQFSPNMAFSTKKAGSPENLKLRQNSKKQQKQENRTKTSFSPKPANLTISRKSHEIHKSDKTHDFSTFANFSGIAHSARFSPNRPLSHFSPISSTLTFFRSNPFSGRPPGFQGSCRSKHLCPFSLVPSPPPFSREHAGFQRPEEFR